MSAPPPSPPSSLSPVRKILSPDDMESFKSSTAYASLLRLIQITGESIRTFPPYTSTLPPPTLSVQALCHGMEYMASNWTRCIPPAGQDKMRFGNTAFRTWNEELVKRSGSFLELVLSAGEEGGVGGMAEADVMSEVERILDLSPGEEGKVSSPRPTFVPGSTSMSSYVPELAAYFTSSFGHPVRLDYGTGHESSFMVLLLSLLSVGVCGSKLSVSKIDNTHKPLLASYVYNSFQAYLKVTRSIQTTYNLEPAGSHGVWGLDDYHCLPFYFGSCELEGLQKSGEGDPEVSLPSCVQSSSVLLSHGGPLMYVGCIKFVRELKARASFGEGSPMLYDISELPSWAKASRGLERLYEGEVLGRYPVVQHFVFGGIWKGEWESKGRIKTAPKNTFVGVGGVEPPGMGGGEGTRAPWATGGGGGGGGGPPFEGTRAPWAK
ncbi:hypothetical protein TrCOL_g4426 [Triparma columacea]|uniref:Serine/threonine-protein phosphatase 2A activator n=1 Tax=Triparma columacea TaxID=722753 RepID=A0A9W7G555_9STRA|nr:hypothetical protein TrCOL_g4426 [Triparma columacea]